jgi:hypothetical protein
MLRRVARGRLTRRDPLEVDSPFETPTGGRPLRLVIDLTTAPSGDALDLLRSFAHHEAVEVLEYRGAIAPRGEPTVPEARTGPGELRLSEPESPTDWVRAKALMDRRTVTTFAGEIHVLRNIAADAGSQPVEDAAQALAVAWATDSLGFDALVTASPSLLGGIHENFVARGNPITVDDACWLLGLHLRSRDDYTLDAGESFTSTTTRSTFFAELARDLLPESWRWLSACAHAWVNDRGSDVMGIGMSGLERFERALRSRDRVTQLRQLPHDSNVVDEEIFAFDVELLMLSAVFDATAMVATRAYALPAKDASVGWRRPAWRKSLGGVDRALFDLTERGTPARDAIEAVALMRNMIHGESLRMETYWPRHHRVRVPDRTADDLRTIAERRGGMDVFGLDVVAGHGLYVDPGKYAERALRLAIDALNALMAATEVERLVNDPTTLLTGPPASDTRDEWRRARCRLLAGL